MAIPLAELKAMAAEYDCTIITRSIVPRGEMMVLDYRLMGMGDLMPGRKTIAVHPGDFPT